MDRMEQIRSWMGKPTELGYWLRDTIYDRGLSQIEVAREAGIPRSTLSEVIKGRKHLSLNAAVGLGRVLGVDPAELLAMEDRIKVSRLVDGYSQNEKPSFRLGEITDIDFGFFIDMYFDRNVIEQSHRFNIKTIYGSFSEVMNRLTREHEIDITVLNGFSYCFYEVLDNVITHSGMEEGKVAMQFDADKAELRVLIADDGMGIAASLAQCEKYSSLRTDECLLKCIEDGVSDGKGRGFGLFSAACMVKESKGRLDIISGGWKMSYRDGVASVEPFRPWQGTVVAFIIPTNVAIDPSKAVDGRTDCVSEYEEAFIPEEISALWISSAHNSELQFRQFGIHLGTRHLGAGARMLLLEKIKTSAPVLCNLSGVEVMSNSFADECFGKLLEQYGLEALRGLITFSSSDALVARSIVTALNRRLLK